MIKLKPVHEMARTIARRHNEDRDSLAERLLFTGNVLVKSQFEQTQLPVDADTETIAMYCVPEFTRAGRLFLKAVMALGNEKVNDLTLVRGLTLNEAAAAGTQPVVVYGPDGPIAK